MKLRRTLHADHDIDGILDDTLRLFGERQFLRYVELMEQALALIASEPLHVCSRNWTDVGHGIRSLRLDHVPQRSKRRASHQIFYSVRDAEDEVVVLRVLYERMEPRRRVMAAVHETVKRS